jgi:hypothetical protein
MSFQTCFPPFLEHRSAGKPALRRIVLQEPFLSIPDRFMDVYAARGRAHPVGGRPAYTPADGVQTDQPHAPGKRPTAKAPRNAKQRI